MGCFVSVDGFRLKKTVRAIVANQSGQILLIRPHGYEPERFTFPGGGVERGESDQQALMRELREEIDITEFISIIQTSVVNWFVFKEEFRLRKRVDYDGQYATYFFVRVKDAAQIAIQANEISAYCWCTPTDVEKKVGVPIHLEMFHKVYREAAQNSYANQN